MKSRVNFLQFDYYFLNEVKYYLSRQEEGYFLLREYSRGLFGWSLSCGPLPHRNSSNDRLSRPHQIFDDANLLPKILPLFYTDLLSVWNTLRFQFEKSELQIKKPLLLVEKSGRIFNACIILHHSIFDFERHRIKLLIFMQDILKCRVKPKKNFSI